MSNENSPPATPTSPSARRASFSPGQKISELFGRSSNVNGNGPPLYPSPIATAAANAQAQQRRRMSITSLGLSGSPTQTSAFTSARARQESFSSGTSPSMSIDEDAIEDGDAPLNGSPSSPFARRMSFGARALREVKTGAGNGNGEGFNWSEQIRSRAARSSSTTSSPAFTNSGASSHDHQRATSTTAMEPPIKEMPKSPKVPDHFQERILKGDFYMD